MSTTFAPATIPADGPVELVCLDGHAIAGSTVDDYDTLVARLAADGVSSLDVICPTCVEGDAEAAFAYPGAHVRPVGHVEPPSVNMATAHAESVLCQMGYDVDEWVIGADDAVQFLARAMLLTVTHDEGVPAYERAVNVIDCGRPAGYYARVGALLVEVAQAAMAAGVPVVWS